MTPSEDKGPMFSGPGIALNAVRRSEATIEPVKLLLAHLSSLSATLHGGSRTLSSGWRLESLISSGGVSEAR